jgi:cytochrome c553
LLWSLPSPAAEKKAEKAPDPRALAFFENKIRPVLVEHCYKCHSAEAREAKKLRGGLLIDTKQGLLLGGDSGPSIVPGDAKKSLLLKTMHYDGDVKMPPKGKLPAAVLADFETWINQGAVDPRSGAVVKAKGLSLDEGRQFWAFRPISVPMPATVKNPKWANDEIDSFVLARLEAAGHAPSPDADRATFIRRVTYDLIGLPPTPQEIDAFVNDKRHDAKQRLVDGLLASPRFGERWGRHYLDLVRYAESITLRGSIFKEAWRYRDYVIDHFNNDDPFDRFLREQIAGDLLSSSSLAEQRKQRIATTFLALGNTNLEEQDKKQLRMDVVDEQLDTIGKAFLAQTIGCARCHDHKFDPIPTKDYYALAGILRNTRTLKHSNVSEWLEMPLPADPVTEKAARDNESAIAALQAKIKTLKGPLVKKGKPGKSTSIALADLPGIVIDNTKAKKVGEWVVSSSVGTFVGENYVHDGATGKGEKTITFQPDIPKTGVYEVRLSWTADANRASKVPVTIFSADGDKTVTIDQTKEPDIDGLFHSLGKYRFEKSGQGFVLIANEETKGHVIADAVQFLSTEVMEEMKTKAKADKKTPDAKGTPASKGDSVAKLEAELKRLQEKGPKRDKVMSIEEEKLIEDARIHIRGLVANLGESAPRGFLQVATSGKTPEMPKNQSGRVQLAQWLASAENPLTARVYANRVWHWLLGEGLVRTTDNFGTTGETPSHPELLDHLASRFVEEGWSLKSLVRRIVLSRTYGQSIEGNAKLITADPENRLFGRANRRRLQAEAIRDTMLFSSGQLNLEMGGRTFAATTAADYNYKHTDTRRSVYSPLFRNSMPELLEAFDGADPSMTTGRRSVSTVAPQALFLMNHPFVMEQSRVTAKRLLAEPDLDEAARVRLAYRRILGREPSEPEMRAIRGYLGKGEEDAWTRVVQVLFASIEFRYIN